MNATSVNQFISAEVLPNASTTTVGTNANAKALVPLKRLILSKKLFHVTISMNVKKMLLSVTIMLLATTPLDHMIVSVTPALKLIQLEYMSVHNSLAQFVLISTSVAMKT